MGGLGSRGGRDKGDPAVGVQGVLTVLPCTRTWRSGSWGISTKLYIYFY